MSEIAERYQRIFQYAPVPMWEQDMTNLTAAIDEVRNSGVTDFKEYLDENPHKVYEWASLASITDVNRAAIGLMQARDLEQFLTSIDKFFEADTFPVFKAQLIAMASEAPYFESEVGIVNLAGKRVHVLMTLTMLEERKRALIAMVNISQRKAAEMQLRATNQELGRSNDELEQYAYVVSHDLQEPLRTVGSYLDLFTKRYRKNLDERATKYINAVTDGASRMRTLINDLLQFSRIGHGEPMTQEIDLSEVVQGLKKSMEATIREQSATLTHDELPTVLGARVQITQVIQNLLSNGLKFQRSGVPPTLHISVVEEGGAWKIGIRDNGVGIEPHNIDAVFSIFMRVHGKGKYPGTGIGLAIVKKIVERHNGRIWVESEFGEGSTFYFTLPKRDAGSAQLTAG